MARAMRPSKRTARAVAYYRQAGTGAQGDSIPVQREQMRAFAERNGIEIVCEFTDGGELGHSLSAEDGSTET